MQTEIDPRDLIGHKAVDRNGDKIGTVDEVYLDDATGQPEWAAVRTGLFGRDAFVPLATSEFIRDELRVPYEKARVKESPDFGAGQHLSPAQELELYRYYGLEVPVNGKGADAEAAKPGMTSSPAATTMVSPAMESPAVPVAAAAAAGAAAGTMSSVPAPASAPLTTSTEAAAPRADSSRTAAFVAGPDTVPATAHTASTPSSPSIVEPPPLQEPAAGSYEPMPVGSSPNLAKEAGTPLPAQTAEMASAGVPDPVEFVCREERLDISTEWRVLGRARLRKYVTTEQVERRVPVIRERIRVERVPVGAEERAQLTDEEIAESTEEVTLHEQRVVVRKAVVPVERIRLITERVTEEEVVRDEIHKEHIQVQDTTRPAGPTPVPGTGQPTAPTPPAYTPPPARPDEPGHAIGA